MFGDNFAKDLEEKRKMSERKNIGAGSRFLPLEYYNLDDEDRDPEKLMEKYKKEGKKLSGFSKFFNNHG